jgi:hypothetical protein
LKKGINLAVQMMGKQDQVEVKLSR